MVGSVGIELDDIRVRRDDVGRDRRGEDEPFEGATAREGYIDLTMRESASGVDDGMVECESLALGAGDGAGRSQGYLRE